MPKFFFFLLMIVFPLISLAQLPVIEIVKHATVKVIKAIDLQVQRWQNETIVLQNAQQAIENAMAELKLQEVGDWVDRQRQLYADYFDELSRVKSAIADYHRVRSILRVQRMIVKEYTTAWEMLVATNYFTRNELDHMQEVYTGILDAGLRDIEILSTFLTEGLVRMNDAERLRAIQSIADSMQEHLQAIQSFNRQNQLLSMERADSAAEVEMLKKMYGL